jgi:hypothetical protein
MDLWRSLGQVPFRLSGPLDLSRAGRMLLAFVDLQTWVAISSRKGVQQVIDLPDNTWNALETTAHSSQFD